MSKNTKTKTPKTFTYTPQNDPPKLGKIKTEWALNQLYYRNERDLKLQADLKTAEKLYINFARKWQNKDFTQSTKALAQALRDYEALVANPAITGPGRYFSFRLAVNSNDTAAQKELAKLSNQFRKLQEKIIFFRVRLGNTSKKQQAAFLRDKALSHFRYYLSRAFLEGSYNLTEAEEKIINLKSRQSYGMWVDAIEKIISNRTVRFKGSDLAIPEALETIDVLKKDDKKRLWQLLMEAMEDIGTMAEHEFNAIITDVRSEDEVRGYAKPYSATAIAYEDTETSIENLVSVMSQKGFALSRKFYKLKAAYHGVDALHYTQKYDSIGADLHIPFTDAVDICRDVFYGVKQEYGATFDHMLTHGQIDVYPRKGKRGGAFMSEQVGHPTQVFLNHLANFKSLETLAHEMGHAIHAERSKQQRSPLYEGHSISTAETASTLFENLLFDAVYEQAGKAQQRVLLHDRLTRDIATMQRQIAFFNCELEIHKTIPEQGAMTNSELAACMQKHLKSYLGSGVAVTKQDGYSYVYVPHLRFGFYVYTYCFGLLMSTQMAEQYKTDKSYVKQIDQFLSAGQSDTVANIFKQIGINTESEDVYRAALKPHEDNIKTFAKLVSKKT